MPKNAGKKPAKYVIVRNHLLDLVRNGLANGSPVPSERELCEQFEVSRMTVRQAIDTLVVDGILERHQGKGTFVAPIGYQSPPDMALAQLRRLIKG